MWLARGETLQVTVSGVFGCGGREGLQAGLSSFDTVPVRCSVGVLLPRTAEVSLGCTYGWTDEPGTCVDDLVELQPRR